MSKQMFILLGITYYIISIIVILFILQKINKKEKSKYEKEILDLERDKNMIISADIMSELQHVEELANSELMKEIYANLKERFDTIKKKDIPKITDDLLKLQELYDNKNYKELKNTISKTEFNVYLVKSKTDYLLKEITNITSSKGRNREIATTLKTRYRKSLTEFNKHKNEYGKYAKEIMSQFDNIDKLFTTFEKCMEKNDYQEISHTIKTLDLLIGNIEIVIEEAPSIILMADKLIPKRIDEVCKEKEKMESDGYNLDYLSIHDNIVTSSDACKNALSKLDKLNVKDSSVELKAILDYFDNLYNEFDKEKLAKNLFLDNIKDILVRANKLERINNDLKRKTNDYNYAYDIKPDDLNTLDNVSNNIKMIKKDYGVLVNAHRNHTTAYTRLNKEVEKLSVSLDNISNKLNDAVSSFGNLKEDEIQAKERLDEIKSVLVSSKVKLKQYNLPIIPSAFYTYLEEAYLAIDEVKKELDKKPMSIKTLNLRVDTARDLSIKLYNYAKEVVKSAYMAEMSIVYGNRYRVLNNELDVALIKAEDLFFQGEYKKSLECSINAIDVIKPDYYDNLRITVSNKERKE